MATYLVNTATGASVLVKQARRLHLLNTDELGYSTDQVIEFLVSKPPSGMQGQLFYWQGNRYILESQEGMLGGKVGKWVCRFYKGE